MKVVRVFRLKKFTSNLFREQIIRIDCKCNIEDRKGRVAEDDSSRKWKLVRSTMLENKTI